MKTSMDASKDDEKIQALTSSIVNWFVTVFAGSIKTGKPYENYYHTINKTRITKT